MDNTFFGRSWRVEFGKPGTEGLSFDSLKTVFEIVKTNDSGTNKSTISLWGLSTKSRATANQKGLAMRLYGGYEKPFLLSQGEILKVNHSEEDGIFKSEFEVHDGLIAVNSTVISQSFKPNTTEKEVIEAVVKKFGLPVGEIKGIPDRKFEQGKQLSGAGYRILDDLCRSRGLVWSIQNGSIQILPKGVASTQTAVLLNKDTGLIGSPEAIESGFKVVSLLQPVNPGQAIKLESKSATGIFLAQKITYRGDSSGSDWYAEIEVTRPA